MKLKKKQEREQEKENYINDLETIWDEQGEENIPKRKDIMEDIMNNSE